MSVLPHTARVVTTQALVAAQQAPVGGGDIWQVFGTQTPAAVQVPVPVQPASVVTVQAPLTAQQEPAGGGVWQVFGLQTLARIHVLPPMQFACVVTVQLPVRVQHAPDWLDRIRVRVPEDPFEMVKEPVIAVSLTEPVKSTQVEK